jgi:hypothetical protein
MCQCHVGSMTIQKGNYINYLEHKCIAPMWVPGTVYVDCNFILPRV